LLSFERLMHDLSHVFLIPPLNVAVMRRSEIVSLPFSLQLVRTNMQSHHDRKAIEPGLVAAGAILGALAVLLGAFGAHALQSRVDVESLGWWHTAVEYQMWHALAVLALGLSGLRRLRLPAWLFVAGSVVFSSTLYAMALGAPRWFGAITPLGGLAMIGGWAVLAVRAARV
jgi:uncharacterized membrane protein YgdD (TMEM256/DUF423 family)